MPSSISPRDQAILDLLNQANALAQSHFGVLPSAVGAGLCTKLPSTLAQLWRYSSPQSSNNGPRLCAHYLNIAGRMLWGGKLFTPQALAKELAACVGPASRQGQWARESAAFTSTMAADMIPPACQLAIADMACRFMAHMTRIELDRVTPKTKAPCRSRF